MKMEREMYLKTFYFVAFVAINSGAIWSQEIANQPNIVAEPAIAKEDWIHWRGPTADGRAGARAKPPIQWDKKKNIKWIASLPGEGSATPIVVGEQVFLLSAVKTSRRSPSAIVNDERAKTVPDELFYEFILLSLERSTGKTLWQKTVAEEVPHEGKHDTNTYAAGSPVTDGERLYFSFGSRGIYSYSLTGDLLWKIDLGDMRTRFGWGEAVTPALTRNAVIVNWDQEEGSFIVAIDKRTGEIIWKTARNKEVTSWNTPFVTTFEGNEQIIVNGTDSAKGYAAADGSLLWECAGQTVNAIPSPIRFGDSVICMSGYRGAMACSIPLNSKGNVTDSGSINWKVTQGTPYVPSPILSGNRLLFTAGNTNVLSCLDAISGQSNLERIRLPGIRSMYASPILANGHFYFVSREGTTAVVKDNETLDVVAVNELDDVIDASPVAVDDQLFLRSWSKIYCIENSPAKDPNKTSNTQPNDSVKQLAFKQVDLETKAETSANVSLGDIDTDGDLDIVLAKGRHWPLHNRLHINDGQGNFELSRNLGERPDRSYSAVLGDIDQDGDLDVVVSNDSPDEKNVLRNDGTGQFALMGNWGKSTWNTRNTTLLDVNGDRFLDLIVANRKSVSFLILNDGQGNFTEERWIAIASESATTIIGADFDGNGHMDLAVPHRDEGTSRVLFNDGKMGFEKTTTFGPPTASTRACASGDLNGDGSVDLILGDDKIGAMICINNGQGEFPDAIPVGDGRLVPYAIAVGDMNQDKLIDVIVGYAKGGSRVFLNMGTGKEFSEVMLGDNQGAVYAIAVGDVNADGRLDIVQARSEATNAMYINLGRTDN
jgi:outer membrane protein assembly factor BamB